VKRNELAAHVKSLAKQRQHQTTSSAFPKSEWQSGGAILFDWLKKALFIIRADSSVPRLELTRDLREAPSIVDLSTNDPTFTRIEDLYEGKSRRRFVEPGEPEAPLISPAAHLESA